MFTPLLQTNKVVPSAIDGRDWQVNQENADMMGATDLKRAKMSAPRGDNATARMVRIHELMHAKITPKTDPQKAAEAGGCSIDALQWAEDTRVGFIMKRNKLIDAEALTVEECDGIAESIPPEDLRHIAAFLMANWFLPAQRERLREAMERRPDLNSADIDYAYLTVERIVKGAYNGYRRHKTKQRTIGKSHGLKKISIPLAIYFDMEFPVNSNRPGGAKARDIGREVQRIKGRPGWGAIRGVDVMALNNRVKPKRPIGRRFFDVGVIPRAVHRLTVDNRVFSERKRVKGGTVLADASGSMHYDYDDIRRILQEAPAATIAFYSGTDGFGSILIGARGGMAADPEAVLDRLHSENGGGNEIDAPALRWLAKQPGPLYWISDEEVGASGGRGCSGTDGYGKHTPAWEECVQICRVAGIHRVESIGKLKMG